MHSVYNGWVDIQIEYYELPDGGICIIPSQTTVDATCALMEQNILRDESLKSAHRQGAADSITSKYRAQVAVALEIAGNSIKTLSFPFRPYTRRERLMAEREATKSPREGEFKTDQDQVQAKLVCTSTGKPMDWLDSLPDVLASAVVGEVMSRNAIDVTRLSFFAFRPAS